MNISIETFRKAVELYLTDNQGKRLNIPKKYTDELKGFMLFNRLRSNIFVLPTAHQFPYTQLGILLPKVSKTIMKDNSLPARIEVYCASAIAVQQEEELTALMRSCGIELNIFDSFHLSKFKQFEGLFSDNTGEFTEIDEASKMLFGMLAEGSNVSEIKSNLICSMIIFLLNEKEKLTEKQLRELAEQKFDHEIGSIEQEVKFLLSKKRIEQDDANKDMLKLTKNEKTVFQKMRSESKREEAAFHQAFISLLDSYKIPDASKLIEQLTSLYVESCEVNIDSVSGSVDDEKRKDQVFREFCNLIKGYLNNADSTEHFLSELRTICMDNPFLEKIGASEMFLSLYRSSKLEQFINSKKKFVYLDTRVLIYYYCQVASRGKSWPYWNDHSYRATCNLASLVTKKNKDIKLRLSEAYLGEIAGELQKALRSAWFDERIKLKSIIPFQTNNVFYNYYLYLCEKDCMDTGNGRLKFSQFVQSMGFSNCEPESPKFIKETKNALCKRLKLLGVEIMPVGWQDPHLYEETMTEWDLLNNSKTYQKSSNAIKADSKQLLHIMSQSLEEDGKECEFYYASWDRSFSKMRDWALDKSNKLHTFFIYNPARMANRFALSHFKIDSKCITHEVFFYADSQFKLRQKIGSLFDHVLIPFFGNREDEGLDLMNLLVEIQDKHMSQHEPEIGDDWIDEKLPLELVFDSIKQSLKGWQCSENDLFKYMTDKKNQVEVTTIFDESFDAISKKRKFDTFISKLGEELRKYKQADSKIESIKL